MSAGADVVVTVRVRPESVEKLRQMTESAIQRGIQAARARIYEQAERYTPVRTGRLLSSFDVAFTPRSIVMMWDAVDPKSGYHYADVVDKGRMGYRPFGGRYFGEALRFEAPQILHEELVNAFNAEMGGATI